VFAMSQIVGKNPDHSNGAGRGQPRLKLLLADDNPALLLEFQRVLVRNSRSSVPPRTVARSWSNMTVCALKSS